MIPAPPSPVAGAPPEEPDAAGPDPKRVHRETPPDAPASKAAAWNVRRPDLEPDPGQALIERLAGPPENEEADTSATEPEAGLEDGVAQGLFDPGAPPEPFPSLLVPPPTDPEPDPDPGAAPRTEVFPFTGDGPATLAFAADPDTERALREGLAGHPGRDVRPGGVSAALTALSAGRSAQLLFVDLDGTAYPAGAIHELAAVCEVGTVVVALGSNGTARFSREILLAGVNDYLVKPVTAAAVRDAAARGGGPAADGPPGGWSVGFTGTGGSGATTLAAATALIAAERGRYVSVLDLNRTFSALSFLLDVEPAAGLVELLSTAARASLHPEMADRMRAERSDRIAVYGYPWSPIPPPLPPVWAVCELLVELQRRSHLVLVDGLDDPATRVAVLATVDARVLVVEATRFGASAAAHLLARLDPIFEPGWPFLLVQNHTRAFRPKAGARTLRDAGIEIRPDVVVPFEPTLPAVADRGWPGGRLPRSLRKPLAALADRVLAGEETAAAVPA